MGNFAIVSEGIVTNIIVADSKEIADQVTGLNCIEYTEENLAYVGGDYIDGYFYNIQPFPSFIRNGEGGWVPPVEHPVFDESNPMYYVWNEETISWDGFPAVTLEN